MFSEMLKTYSHHSDINKIVLYSRSHEFASYPVRLPILRFLVVFFYSLSKFPVRCLQTAHNHFLIHGYAPIQHYTSTFYYIELRKLKVKLYLSSREGVLGEQRFNLSAWPSKRNHGMHWILGWLDPQTRTWRFGEENISCPCSDSKPGSSSRRLVAILTMLSRFLVNPLNTSAYRAVNTLHFGYKNQSLNVL
jgi:hypothetical protein